MVQPREEQKSETLAEAGWNEVQRKKRGDVGKNQKQGFAEKWVSKSLHVNDKEERGEMKSVSDPNPFEVLCETYETCNAAYPLLSLDKT